MRINVSHVTKYTYESPLGYGLQQLRLTPRSSQGQSVLRWETTVRGGKKELAFDDHHGNRVELVSCEPDQHEVVIASDGVVETANAAGIFGRHTGLVPLWYFTRQTELTEPGAEIRRVVREIGATTDDLIAQLHSLAELISSRVKYETGRTDSDTTAEAALAAGHGVCQDHTHLFVSVARMIGVPARYVSGYLQMDNAEAPEASHAWAEAHIDDVGWIGFDISNGISPDERYVRVAAGLDYREAAPIRGMLFGNSTESMVVSVQVQQ